MKGGKDLDLKVTIDELFCQNHRICTNLTPLFLAQEEFFQTNLLNNIKMIRNLEHSEIDSFIEQFSKNIRLLINLQVVSLSNFMTLTEHPNFFQCKSEIKCCLKDSWDVYLELKQAIKWNFLCSKKIKKSLKDSILDKLNLVELMLRQKLEMFDLHERNVKVKIIDCGFEQTEPWFG
jgi:hypothetical protein